MANETRALAGYAAGLRTESVPPEVLKPRETWASRAEYDLQASKLAKMFVDNFKNFEADVTPEVRAAGPTA